MGDQAERIYAQYGLNSERGRKASEILKRYARNIENSKTWKNAFQKGKQDFIKADPDNAFRLGETTSKGYQRADNVKVSRNTYMGLNKG